MENGDNQKIISNCSKNLNQEIIEKARNIKTDSDAVELINDNPEHIYCFEFLPDHLKHDLNVLKAILCKQPCELRRDFMTFDMKAPIYDPYNSIPLTDFENFPELISFALTSNAHRYVKLQSVDSSASMFLFALECANQQGCLINFERCKPSMTSIRVSCFLDYYGNDMSQKFINGTEEQKASLKIFLNIIEEKINLAYNDIKNRYPDSNEESRQSLMKSDMNEYHKHCDPIIKKINEIRESIS